MCAPKKKNCPRGGGIFEDKRSTASALRCKANPWHGRDEVQRYRKRGYQSVEEIQPIYGTSQRNERTIIKKQKKTEMRITIRVAAAAMVIQPHSHDGYRENKNKVLKRKMRKGQVKKHKIHSFERAADFEEMPYKIPHHSSTTGHGTFKKKHPSIEVGDDFEHIDPDTAFQEKQTDKLPIRPTRKRLVEKNGQRNVRSRHIPKTRYLQDVFTTILDARWKWMFFFFTVVYLFTWVIFATMWWIIFEGRDGTDKCVVNVKDWKSAFLFSVETQQTIGYGTRAVTENCPEATLLLIVQVIVGMLVDAILLGLVFAKLARPNKRSSTILFSENAAISKRDDKFCLMFQVADVRKRQLPEAHVRAYLFRSLKTKEGRMIPFHHESLQVGHDHQKYDPDVTPDRLFLLFPVTVVHIIDEKSPFYDIGPEELKNSDWEVVVILEGVVEATGCTVQTRTSYLGDEIMWGNDFIDVFEPNDWLEDEGYRYDLFKMNVLSPTATPRCSAKDYERQQELQNGHHEPSENGVSNTDIDRQISIGLTIDNL